SKEATMFTKHAKKLVSSVVMLGVLALSLAAAAGAETITTHCQTGQCGEHATTSASCDVTLQPSVLVHAPEIKSTWVNYPGNVWVQVNHLQVVGYRSWLLRFNETTRTWVFTD